MKRWIVKIIIFLAILILQMSFIPALSSPFSDINLVLALVFFLTLTFHLRQGLWWGVLFGILLDFFSFPAFGMITFSLLSSVLIIHMLFEILFTNKSLYALLLLGMLGTLIYHLIFGFLLASGHVFGFWDHDAVFHLKLLIHIGWQLVFTSIILLLLWKAVKLFTKRLHLQFLTPYGNLH